MKIIKNSPTINSAIKAWNGEEKLQKVFWLWGVLFYVSCCYFIFFVFTVFEFLSYENPKNLNILITIFTLSCHIFYSILIFLCAFTLAFIYPIIFLIALNRCCHNKASKVAMKLFSIFAICGHSFIVMLCCLVMFFSLRWNSDIAYLVVKKITDYIYNKTTENIFDSKIINIYVLLTDVKINAKYVILTGLIYLIILYYLIDVINRFFNQNTKLLSNKSSFKSVFKIASFVVIMITFFCFVTWEQD